ncbi:MAG: zinc-binding dehydrogenase [Clostridiales Family XIII bacterium]|jgi:2-desacetyl-2-hydroxyethyl bacteriochlorophyllide A dehydrogenase|nr:zinc-binding dehydrogenase [Clostridiales Family XIII bacterium]
MKPETYKAAIYRGIGNVEVVDMPYPECGDDDAIVRNLISPICGSDVSAYQHGGDANRIWKDGEFGHEMVSEVVEIGKNVKGLKLGDRVFPNMDKAKRDRMRVATVGGFSEYVHIPQCEVGYSVLMLPDDIPLESAALMEPFVIGTRGAKSTEPKGKTVTVFGAGAIGMSAAIMSKWYGAEKVMVVDISDKRLDVAKSFGLETCNSASEDLKAKSIEAFGASMGLAGECSACDVYIDAVGNQAILDSFQMLAKPMARLAVVGVYHEPGSLNMVGLCYANWQISGCGRSPIEELWPEILAMMQSGQYDIPKIISHKYKIDDIEEAIKQAMKADESLKVAINYVD